MGRYLCRLIINDIVGLVVPWCLSALVIGGGYCIDELIELDLCVLVSVAIYFVPIVKEFGETGSLGGLGKLF